MTCTIDNAAKIENILTTVFSCSTNTITTRNADTVIAILCMLSKNCTRRNQSTCFFQIIIGKCIKNRSEKALVWICSHPTKRTILRTMNSIVATTTIRLRNTRIMRFITVTHTVSTRITYQMCWIAGARASA